MHKIDVKVGKYDTQGNRCFKGCVVRDYRVVCKKG